MEKELFLIGASFCGVSTPEAGYLSHCAKELIDFLGPAQEGDTIIYLNTEDENLYCFERAKDFFSKQNYKIVSIGEVSKPYNFERDNKVKAFFIEGNDIYNLIHLLKDVEIFDQIVSLVKNGQKKYIGSGDGLRIACPIVYSREISRTIPWGVDGFDLVDFQIHQNKNLASDDQLVKWYRKFYDLPLYYLSKKNWIKIKGSKIVQGG